MATIYPANQLVGQEPDPNTPPSGLLGYTAYQTPAPQPSQFPQTSDYNQLSTLPTGQAPTAAQASNYDASTQGVAPDALVENRMTGLLSSNSPYLQEAQTRALQTANQRGLLNSSIAAGAGTQAAIQSALPIAQQDAGAWAQQNLSNQAAQNAAKQFNATANTDVAKFNADASNAMANARLSAGLESQLSGQNFLQTVDAMNQEYNRRLDVLNAEIGGNLDLQALKNLGAFDLEKLKQKADEMNLNSTLFSQYASSMLGSQEMLMRELTSIQQNAALTSDQKKDAINTAISGWQATQDYVNYVYQVTGNWDWSWMPDSNPATVTPPNAQWTPSGDAIKNTKAGLDYTGYVPGTFG